MGGGGREKRRKGRGELERKILKILRKVKLLIFIEVLLGVIY